MRRSRLPIFFLLLLFVYALTELSSFFVLKNFVGRSVAYRPINVTKSDYEEYLEKRDPITGWPQKISSDQERAEDGSRRSDFPGGTSRPPCLSLFGDSFAWGEEVSYQDAWPEKLSQLLNCRVGNFGVGGFGTDQALLRFESMPALDSEIFMLSFISENILRNVNQYRDFLYPGEGLGLKPRFLVSKHAPLQLLPLPSGDYQWFQDAIRQPANAFAHDYFVPSGPAGVQFLSYPFLIKAMKALGHYHIQSNLRGIPRYLPFFGENHPSNALQVTKAIFLRFSTEARARGGIPVVVFLPLCKEIRFFRETGTVITQELLRYLSENNILAINLMDAFAGPGYENFFGTCGSHYNAAGNALVATELQQPILKLLTKLST